MSEKSTHITSDDVERRFKERVTAFIGIGIFMVAGLLSLVAAYTAATGENGFSNMKDLLASWSGLVGAVSGYYFGRIGVEERAKTAESTVQMTQDAWKKAQQEAAQATARLDVEGMAREAAERDKELVEDKMKQINQIVTDAGEDVQTMRDKVANFANKAALVSDAASEMFRSLGGEKEHAPPAIKKQEANAMLDDLDALMKKLETAKK